MYHRTNHLRHCEAWRRYATHGHGTQRNAAAAAAAAAACGAPGWAGWLGMSAATGPCLPPSCSWAYGCTLGLRYEGGVTAPAPRSVLWPPLSKGLGLCRPLLAAAHATQATLKGHCAPPPGWRHQRAGCAPRACRSWLCARAPPALPDRRRAWLAHIRLPCQTGGWRSLGPHRSQAGNFWQTPPWRAHGSSGSRHLAAGGRGSAGWCCGACEHAQAGQRARCSRGSEGHAVQGHRAGCPPFSVRRSCAGVRSACLCPILCCDPHAGPSACGYLTRAGARAGQDMARAANILCVCRLFWRVGAPIPRWFKACRVRALHPAALDMAALGEHGMQAPDGARCAWAAVWAWDPGMPWRDALQDLALRRLHAQQHGRRTVAAAHLFVPAGRLVVHDHQALWVVPHTLFWPARAPLRSSGASCCAWSPGSVSCTPHSFLTCAHKADTGTIEGGKGRERRACAQGHTSALFEHMAWGECKASAQPPTLHLVGSTAYKECKLQVREGACSALQPHAKSMPIAPTPWQVGAQPCWLSYSGMARSVHLHPKRRQRELAKSFPFNPTSPKTSWATEAPQQGIYWMDEGSSQSSCHVRPSTWPTAGTLLVLPHHSMLIVHCLSCRAQPGSPF